MRIYIAGYYSAHGSETAYAKASGLADPAFILESYHYMSEKKANEIREKKQTIFLDSGAFSMFTQGIEVDLASYAQYIKDHQDIIHLASNLDAIGAGQEQLSYDRQKQLEAMGVEIGPVHHARDLDHWLKRYLDEGYQYIFLGGMVPETTAYLREWLDHVWHHYLTKADGSPRVKVHGFGLTTLQLMFRYPWFSVDSTTWVMVSRFGSVIMDLPQPDGTTKDYKVDFSSRSNKRREIDSWHFTSMPPEMQRKVLQRLEELEAARKKYPEREKELEEALGYKQGYNQTALAESYGWRDHFNINYFRRAQERKVLTFKREQETLFT